MFRINSRNLLYRATVLTLGLAIVLKTVVFVLTLFVPNSEAHEIGQGSKVVVEAKLVLDNAEPVDWPEARGLLSCVQAGLVSQERSGAYTLTGYVRHWETDTTHNTVAIVLHGDGGMLTKFDGKFGGRDPRELISQVTNPTFYLFTNICEVLTNTVITFTPVPVPGHADR